MSAAARKLNVSQPTITRYLQSLARWSGRELIEISRMSDPQDPGVNVAITEAGQQLFEIAEDVIGKFSDFRTEEAKAEELISEVQAIVGKMSDDLESSTPSATATLLAENIRTQSALVGNLTANYPLDFLVTLRDETRSFFSLYENDKTSEQRQSKKKRRKGRGAIDPATLTVPGRGN